MGDTGRPTPVPRESIWSQPPTPRATASLAGRDEYVTLPELLGLAVANGFALRRPTRPAETSGTPSSPGTPRCMPGGSPINNADHEDRGEVQQRAARQRAAYFIGYRGALGFAYLGLVAV